MKSIFALIVLIAIFCTGAVARASSWDGEYGGGCGSNQKYDCDLVLKDIRKGKVDASLTITGGVNAAGLKCELHGTFSGDSHVLHGKLSQSDRKLDISQSSSGVLLRGVDGKANACGIELDGELDIMGE